jgi:hypothetical protein
MRFGTRPLLLGALALVSCSTNAVHFKPSFFAASTDVIDFGDQVSGTTAQRTVFFLNSGQRSIALSMPTGDTLGGAFVALLEKTTIDPNGDAVVRIAFSPSAVQPYSTTLTFPNDSGNEPAFVLTLKGNGTQGDPCAGLTCNTPPGGVCLDGMKARHYDPAGVCAAGKCTYSPIDQACANGCDTASGMCAGDPCIGVACNTPPKLACIDAGTSRNFNPQGLCAVGKCSYAPIDTPCSFGCNATTGACAADPCQGVTCQTPPNGCFLPQGTCMNGGCTYSVNNGAVCDDGNACTAGDACSQGACRGTPLSCATPPADVCADAMTLWKYPAGGSCMQSAGACNYPYQQVPCVYGCANGACQNDPCAGGCDDGNACTTDYCVQGVGCHHDFADGNACTTGSGDCPVGSCSSGICQVDQTQTCVAKIQQDLCGEVDVPGVCASNGTCVVQQPPPDFMCPECGMNVLCIKCSPVPGLELHFCL